jgi:hypothetical protein
MKVQPTKRCHAPGYPPLQELRDAPDWAARVPFRWESLPGFAALLGLLALSGDARADADDARPAVSQAPSATKPAPAESTVAQAVQQVNAIVAPLLDEALLDDGRGAFGCMVVNPPTFLAEDEAIELIRWELRSAGLDVKERVILDRVKAPCGQTTNWTVEETKNEDGETVIHMRMPQVDGEEYADLMPQSFRFDLADPGQSVYVEYLSKGDYPKWKQRSASTWSSVHSCNFPKLARRISTAWGEREADRRTIFGVFFDPLASVEPPPPPELLLRPGMTDEQRLMAREKYLAEMRRQQAGPEEKEAKDKALAKDKLRKQVRHFGEFLRQEGVVGKDE